MHSKKERARWADRTSDSEVVIPEGHVFFGQVRCIANGMAMADELGECALGHAREEDLI